MTKGSKWHYKQRFKKKKYKDDEVGPVLTKTLHENIQKIELNSMKKKKNWPIWYQEKQCNQRNT